MRFGCRFLIAAITWFLLFKKTISIGNFIKKVWTEIQGFIHKASPFSLSFFPRRPFIRFSKLSATATLFDNSLLFLTLYAFMSAIKGFKVSRIQGFEGSSEL